MRKVIRKKGDYARFQENTLVRTLLDRATANGYGLNELWKDCCDAKRKDWEEFYQLIGYSLNGYMELPMVSERHKDWAWDKLHEVENENK